ncbi:DUF2460 domain-containing protein [Sphingomonas paeninsulae]|uniref:DUF2460 domain-containing protein n=1 Tax=Sphingomonas paeninsulae TaxID=2319844 RepID=UPI0013CEC30D|nr:DUF2460 domain-containing protein [Sphingomonas paeninsulae]
MSNAVFPALTGLTFPVVKTPMWSTKTQDSVSGKETRIGFWSYPKWKYSLAYDILRSDNVNLELQTLAGFYNARNGGFDTWLFNDPDDNSVTLQGFGIGDGASTNFQLTRSLGGYVEPVLAVNATSAPAIYINGTLKIGGTDYTLNVTTGLVTFTTAPAVSATLTWTGSYYWRCKFLDDSIDLSKFMQNLWELQTLNFQSVK